MHFKAICLHLYLITFTCIFFFLLLFLRWGQAKKNLHSAPLSKWYENWVLLSSVKKYIYMFTLFLLRMLCVLLNLPADCSEDSVWQRRVASQGERGVVHQLFLYVCVCVCVCVRVCVCVCARSKLSQVTQVFNANAQIPSFPGSMNETQLDKFIEGWGSETRWEALKRKRQLCDKSTARGGVGTRLHCLWH